MADKTKPFKERDVTLTLTGEEWTVLIARACGKVLSPQGLKVAISANRKLLPQLEKEID